MGRILLNVLALPPLLLSLTSLTTSDAFALAAGASALAAKDTAQPAETPPSPGAIDAGRFGEVLVYRPAGIPRSVAIVLSGETGWRGEVVGMARQLTAQGAMVIGVDTPRFLHIIGQDRAGCEYPGGDLEGLGHFVQAYYRLPTYAPPILVGYASGAGLAYASLAQSPPGTFAGAMALAFEPRLRMRTPLCQQNALKLNWHPARASMDLLPAEALADPLDIVEREGGPNAPKALEPFAAAMPNLGLIRLGRREAFGGAAPVQTAFESLQQGAQAEALPPSQVPGMPLLEIAASAHAKPQDTFAILMTGDGGWSRFEEKLAKSLAAHGVPVVGMDTLRYFWTPRTPAGAAADMDGVIRQYLARWHKSRVLMVGYSQGADVLPFIYNRLPDDTRRHVLLSGEIGLGDRAVFAFHLADPVTQEARGLPTTPEMQKLENSPMLCIYGAGETDSLCPHLDPKRAHLDELEGGHDAGGDSHLIADAILSAAHLD